MVFVVIIQLPSVDMKKYSLHNSRTSIKGKKGKGTVH